MYENKNATGRNVTHITSCAQTNCHQIDTLVGLLLYDSFDASRVANKCGICVIKQVTDFRL